MYLLVMVMMLMGFVGMFNILGRGGVGGGGGGGGGGAAAKKKKIKKTSFLHGEHLRGRGWSPFDHVRCQHSIAFSELDCRVIAVCC
jgi:hypothetical protein